MDTEKYDVESQMIALACGELDGPGKESLVAQLRGNKEYAATFRRIRMFFKAVEAGKNTVFGERAEGCPDGDTLVKMCETPGALAENQLMSLEKHVKKCESCAEILAGLKKMEASIAAFRERALDTGGVSEKLDGRIKAIPRKLHHQE
jgi:hypothetical protein